MNRTFQEEPLPHELRPTGVLCMTMDYLATCIMDIGEGRRAEWYDYLWNRTRAIRKVSGYVLSPCTAAILHCTLPQDITIQHLCNKECVGLVERCARYYKFNAIKNVMNVSTKGFTFYVHT